MLRYCVCFPLFCWQTTLGAANASLVTMGTLPADVQPDFGWVTDAAPKWAHEKLVKLVPNASRR
jgi:hypothetical protein